MEQELGSRKPLQHDAPSTYQTERNPSFSVLRSILAQEHSKVLALEHSKELVQVLEHSKELGLGLVHSKELVLGQVHSKVLVLGQVHSKELVLVVGNKLALEHSTCWHDVHAT